MSKTRRKAGRPPDEAKRNAILCAAGDCFLKAGFSGASMDAIARAADVSKLTVYNHFRDKESLFKAVIAEKCAEFAPPQDLVAMAGEAPDRALTRIAGGFMQLMMRPEVIAMHRVIPAEAASSPKMARLFYEAGPQPMLSALSALLKAWVAKGTLEVPDPERAADHFFSMLKGMLHFRMTMNIGPPPSGSELRQHVEDCVDMFLRAYRKR